MSDSSRQLAFSSGSEIGSQQCFSIVTNVDSAVEGDQGFMVSLVDVSGDPADIVTITSPSAQAVTIQDNTGLSSTALLYIELVVCILQISLSLLTIQWCLLWRMKYQ